MPDGHKGKDKEDTDATVEVPVEIDTSEWTLEDS